MSNTSRKKLRPGISLFRSIILLGGSFGRDRKVPLFNTGSYAPTFREEVVENVEGAPGSTFILVKWEHGAWYRECFIDSDAAAYHEGRKGDGGEVGGGVRVKIQPLS